MSAVQLGGSNIGQKLIPRHWMVVSIPVDHPDAPPRQGLVRGQYESVELIREIPLAAPKVARSTTDLLERTKDKESGRPRGSTIGFAESRGKDAKGEKVDIPDPDDDPELNPVEWIMVTRSDPGGGIPRFLVDRGTPPSIAADAVKFLDWACSRNEFESDEEAEAEDPEAAGEGRRPSYSSFHQSFVAGVNKDMDRSMVINRDRDDEGDNGLLSSVTQAIGAGITANTPDMIKDRIPGMFPREDDHDTDNDSTETSSMESFASAENFYTAEAGPHDSEDTPIGSRSDIAVDKLDAASASQKSLDSKISLASSDKTDKQPLTSNEKELAKIDAKKQHLEKKLAESREKQETAARQAAVKSEEEANKTRERHDRELKKQEDRHAREMRKLEEKREKEIRRMEAKRKKEEAKDQLAMAVRDRDEYKQKVDVLEKENAVLRDRMGELQKENTMLVAKLGRSDLGHDMLKQVRDEIGSETSSRRRSVDSSRSKDSANSRRKDAEETA